MPHRPGHGRPGFSPPASTPSPAFSPQDMNIQPAPAPSQSTLSLISIALSPSIFATLPDDCSGQEMRA